MDILYSNLLSESILDFGKWSNWKYTNKRICVFSLGPLPKVQNWFRKQIWNLFWSVSVNIKKVKIWIFHCISKSDLTGVGYIFWQNFISEKAKLSQICLNLGGSMPEAQIQQCRRTPSPDSDLGLQPIIKVMLH